MVHPKNQRDVGAPRKVEWTCLGLHAFGYGLAGVSMDWLWKGLARCGGERSSGTTVFPQTQRVRLVFLCVGVTEPLPFLPQGQGKDKPCLRERTNRRLLRQSSKKYSTEADVSHIVTCSRTHQGMDPDGLENGCSPQKKSPKKPINRMCLGEESTDDPHTVRQQHRRLHTVRQQHHRPKTEGASKVDRDGVAGNSLRQSVQFT